MKASREIGETVNKIEQTSGKVVASISFGHDGDAVTNVTFDTLSVLISERNKNESK